MRKLTTTLNLLSKSLSKFQWREKRVHDISNGFQPHFSKWIQDSRASVCRTGFRETKQLLGPERALLVRESLVLTGLKVWEPTSGPNGVGRIDLGARESHRKRRCDIDSGAQVLRERTDFWKSTMGAKTDHHSQFT